MSAAADHQEQEKAATKGVPFMPRATKKGPGTAWVVVEVEVGVGVVVSGQGEVLTASASVAAMSSRPPSCEDGWMYLDYVWWHPHRSQRSLIAST